MVAGGEPLAAKDGSEKVGQCRCDDTSRLHSFEAVNLSFRSAGRACKYRVMQPAVDERILLEAFGICVVAFMVIVAFHLVGLHIAVRLFKAKLPMKDLRNLRFSHTIVLILGVMFLLFGLHMLTNFAWGFFIYMEGALSSFRQGIFYSLENYTALGLTRVDVGDEWRMLAPMISLSGVFCLSWSTAVLVSFFGHLYSLTDD